MKINFKPFHILSRNHGSAIPRHQIYFDTETRFKVNDKGETEHTLKLGCAIYKRLDEDLRIRTRKVGYFRTPDEFYNMVMKYVRPKTKVVMFAHNIFFDLWISKFYLKAFHNGWTSRVPYSKGMVYIDQLKKGKSVIQLINTGNFFQTTVKKLGELVDLPKLDVDFKHVTDLQLLSYCQRDVEIIEKAMSGWFQFVREQGLGNYAYTLAGQAFNAYRHKFMPCKIYLHRENQPEDLEKEAYFGGRCECFYIGRIKRHRTYKLDINSMYPGVMKDNHYPVRFKYCIDKPTVLRLGILIKKYCAVAKVDIHTDKPAYPIKQDGKLIFPVGEFTTALCTPELAYAMEHKHIIKVHRLALYDKAVIFRQFVSTLYDLRKKYKEEGNNIYQHIVKILLNALYGKFAQKKRESETEIEEDLLLVKSEYIFDMETQENSRSVTFGGTKKVTTTIEKPARDALTAISAHVTSYGRVKMQKVIDKLPKGSYYYCDTDSLFVNSKAKKILKDELSDSELGMWKVEEVTNSLDIRGLKDYTFGQKTKRKGISRSASRLRENVYKMDIWPGFPEVFNSRLDEPYRVKTVIKHIKNVYDKGIKQTNGQVEPLFLDNLS